VATIERYDGCNSDYGDGGRWTFASERWRPPWACEREDLCGLCLLRVTCIGMETHTVPYFCRKISVQLLIILKLSYLLFL